MAPHVDGHMIGGCFYMLYGLTCWILPTMWIHMKSRTEPQIPKVRNCSQNSNSESFSKTNHAKLKEHLERFTWLPQPCCPRFPLEPIMKFVIPTIGVIIELFFIVKTPAGHRAHVTLLEKPFHIWNEDGTIDVIGIKKPYHATVYGAFLLSGIVDVLVMLFKLPRQTSPLFLFLAFVVQGILFFFHIKGQTPIEAHIHSVLTTIVFSCITFSLVHVFHATKFVINLGLGCSIVLLGMWFFLTGYLRNYSHQYHLIDISLTSTNATTTQSTETLNMFRWYITACFAWLVIGVATSMVVLWMILLCVQKVLQKRHHGTRESNHRSSNYSSCANFCKLIRAGDIVTLFKQVRGYKKVVLESSQVDENECFIISFSDPNQGEERQTRNGQFQSNTSTDHGAKTSGDAVMNVGEEEQSSSC